MFTSASLHSPKFTNRVSAGKSTHCSYSVSLAQEDLLWPEGTHLSVHLHTHWDNKSKEIKSFQFSKDYLYFFCGCFACMYACMYVHYVCEETREKVPYPLEL